MIKLLINNNLIVVIKITCQTTIYKEKMCLNYWFIKFIEW